MALLNCGDLPPLKPTKCNSVDTLTHFKEVYDNFIHLIENPFYMQNTQVKERPILMAEKTAKATFNGDKTETRRPIKPQLIHPDNLPPSVTVFDKGIPMHMLGMSRKRLRSTYNPTNTKPWDYYGIMAKVVLNYPEAGDVGITERWIHCPYGKPGDVLWVREAFSYWQGGNEIVYRAGSYFKNKLGQLCQVNYGKPLTNWKWKPSIFMPRAASRMNLIITSIHAEPLLDITDEGAIAEGFHSKADFLNYWDWLNGPGEAAKNPWVWVVRYNCVHNLSPFKK